MERVYESVSFELPIMDVDCVKWQWELFAASHRLFITLHCAILAIVSIHQFLAGAAFRASQRGPADFEKRRAPPRLPITRKGEPPDIQGGREMNHADDGIELNIFSVNVTASLLDYSSVKLASIASDRTITIRSVLALINHYCECVRWHRHLTH